MDRNLLIRLGSVKDFPTRARGPAGKKLCFSKRSDFERFVKSMGLLAAIRATSPHTVYGLAKAIGKDVANVAKIVAFYEELGVITIKKTKYRGRSIKTPVVAFDRITFELGDSSEVRARRALLAIARRR
ncbi:MAG: HVO_A0114 family putative DNA-binding protein [Bdellovibrionota bacterium]